MKFFEIFGHRLVSRLFPPVAVSSNGRFNRHLRNNSARLSYSRMLDMGGAPSANSDKSLIRTVNASKNNRLQVVAFDFKSLININDSDTKISERSFDEIATVHSTNNAVKQNRDSTTAVDTDRVKQVADLLNVDLGSSPDGKVDGQSRSANKKESKSKDHNPLDNDIRAKYASKLTGGLAGIELAKSQVQETLTTGDAAGHLAARKIAIMDGTTTNPNDKKNSAKRWLPSLAATQLLTLLTHRSMRIVLLPALGKISKISTSEEDEPRMEDFKAQLKNVVIDNIIPKFGKRDGNEEIEDALRKGILNEFDVHPNKVLLVSDRDQYLRIARDMGMSICKVQGKNARRGNITAHHTVQTVGQVKDVVNEINGISFNTLL
eukprot:CAMPEP_0197193188 /NCGR_PEP_ID=MMETSP1423-20130617/26657_1 /TAXON_ID=476441 /ORGANISM="Pseudo-nitzschia heimii, Strain UNC1101" /LENGTH=376 /DNA_ID=CAMNT_0042646305 /DNA_START=146 /DNA_END=1272 /DNA_ORIENTATION=+